MMDLQRQSGVIPTEEIQNTRVTIIGAGAIGSHVCECLCKVGVEDITIYDNDTIETHNLPNQGFGLDELGLYKVEALTTRLLRQTGVQLKPHKRRVTKDTEIKTEYVLCCVDSLSARKEIIEGIEANITVEHFLDARMGARYGKVFYVNMLKEEEVTAYKETLEVTPYTAPCTEKATIFCAYGLASILTALMVSIKLNEPVHKMIDIDFANKMMSVA